MGGGSTTAKTTSYVLVAADAGTTVAMNAAGSTTITVNTSLFSAGDSVFIQNWGAGTCTVTAGTATVTTHGSLALSQWEGGTLYFTSSSAAIFFDISQSTGMTNPMTTTGDVIYSSSGSTPARLGIGTANQVLRVNSGATAPEWATASSGGMTLLSTTTLSGASTTISSIDQTYTDLSVRIISPLTSANGYLAIDPNASTTISDNIQLESVGTTVQGTSRGSDEIRFNYNTAMKSSDAAQVALLTICNYASTSYRKPIIGSYAYVAGGDSSKRQGYVGGMINTTSAITSLVITTIGGTSFSSGTVLVYGVK